MTNTHLNSISKTSVRRPKPTEVNNYYLLNSLHSLFKEPGVQTENYQFLNFPLFL